MGNFLKGIVVGLGAVAPGLSGSILLVIFGLYQPTIGAISTIFQNFKKNVKFLFPLGLGILVGIILFSRVVDHLLAVAAMPTRFGFLGLILGALPMFWREVRRQGFGRKYYCCIAAALLAGILLFRLNRGLFPVVTEPDLLQSMMLGLVVAASYIVPGVDSAAILSAFGLYQLWVHSLAVLNFSVLLPAAVGLALGALTVSYLISKLIARCYTLTFSVIFGLFLSVVPSVLDESCVLGFDVRTGVSLLALAVCFGASLMFSNLEKRRQ